MTSEPSRLRAITAAAEWLAAQDDDKRPSPVVPELRRRFNLSPVEAVAAIREASVIVARSR